MKIILICSCYIADGPDTQSVQLFRSGFSYAKKLSGRQRPKDFSEIIFSYDGSGVGFLYSLPIFASTLLYDTPAERVIPNSSFTVF